LKEGTRYVEWKKWSTAEFGSYVKLDDLYYTLELRKSGISNRPGLRVVEFGFGNGPFAGWLRNQRGDWKGVEQIPELLQKAQACGYQVAPSMAGLRLAPASQDLVVAFDVLEHLELEQIRSLLSEAHSLLRSAGRLIVRMPSGDSPFVNALFTGDLTHKTLLGSGAVRLLAAEHGFHIIQLRPPAFPIRGFGMLKGLWKATFIGVRYVLHALIGRVLVENAQAVLTPNMTVVMEKRA
jgi:SAM-dependent methyltransferase